MPPQNLTALLAALEGVAPAIRSAAGEADRAGRFPDRVSRQVAEAGLFRAWIPRTYEGDELPLPDAIALFEAASAIDGAAGWLITIGIGGGLFGAHMEPEAAREVFLPRGALIAGSGSPSGTATPVEDGYRVSGRWRYASGAHHATWFTANCILQDGREASDAPTVRAVALPPPEVEVIETWDVHGLRATGSHDMRVGEAFVPAHRMFDVFGEPREDGPLYRFPFGTIAQCSFASVALGIARHALDVFAVEVPPHRRELPHVPEVLQRAEAGLRGARSAFLDQASKAWEVVVSGDEVGAGRRDEVRRAAVGAARASVAAVESVYLEAGMAPAFLGSTLGRCWRDVHVVSQHIALAAEWPWQPE